MTKKNWIISMPRDEDLMGHLLGLRLEHGLYEDHSREILRHPQPPIRSLFGLVFATE